MKKERGYKKKVVERRSVYIAAVILFSFLIAGAFLCFRLRGGVQVRPSRDNVREDADIVFYRQDDARWAEDKLGDSEYTMRSSGCLVSCIASALSMEGAAEETPGTLNKKFSAGKVYDGEGNLQWGQLAGQREYQVDVYEAVSSDQIDACLKEGHFPIVRVRMYAFGNVHYVLIVGAEDGAYLCMDPLRDELTKLSAYGNRVYALRCVSLSAAEKEEFD